MSFCTLLLLYHVPCIIHVFVPITPIYKRKMKANGLCSVFIFSSSTMAQGKTQEDIPSVVGQNLSFNEAILDL